MGILQNTLEIRDLSIDFDTPHETVHALRNVNFSVPKEKMVGVVGESGCGKSTVAFSVMRLLAHNAIIQKGEILFEDIDILKCSEDDLRNLRGQKISMILQDSATSLNPVISIGRQMIDIMYRQTGLTYRKKKRLAVNMIRQVGITDPETRLQQYPHELSGGMRQRVSIAMALLSNPRLLIADEPTTALDVTMGAQIMHLLREMQENFRCAMLIISHNLGLIAEFCDEVVVMYAGEVVERGTAEDIFYDAHHPYTEKLLECDPTTILKARHVMPTIPGYVPDLKTHPDGCIFADRCHKAITRCTKDRPLEQLIDGLHYYRCLSTETPGSHSSKGFSNSVSSPVSFDESEFEQKTHETPLLSVHELQVRFRTRGPIAALITGTKDPFIDACLKVSLEIMPGETYGLIGESGAGKSTLGNSIIGLVKFKKGRIDFSNQSLKGLTDAAFKKIRREMTMVFQDPIASLSPRRTARSLVLEPFEIHGIQNIDMDKEAERLFSMVGLSRSLYERYPHQLSDGQARRVGIARALALSPRLVIADEPTAGLDVSVQGEILNLMGKLQRELNLSYLIISHNLPVVRHICDKLAIMYLGRLVEQGNSGDIFTCPAHPYTKALIDGIPKPAPAEGRKRVSIEGEMPGFANRPDGCEFHSRCSYVQKRCEYDKPDRREIAPGHFVQCHFPLK